MPLIKSKSKAAVSSNIREMIAAGHPRAQAVAAALDTQRRSKRAKGGDVPPLRSGQIDDYGFHGEVDPEAQEQSAFDLPLGRPLGEEFALLRRKPPKNDAAELTRDMGLPPRPVGGLDWNMPRSENEMKHKHTHGRAPGGSVLGALPDNREWAERVVRPMDNQYDQLAKPVTGPDLGPEQGRVYSSRDLQDMRNNTPSSLDERYGGYEPTSHMMQRAQRDLGLPPSPFGASGRLGPSPVAPQPYDTRRDQQPGETMMGWIERLEREARSGRANGGPIGYASGGGWAGALDDMDMTPSEVAPKPGRPDLSQVGFFGKHTPWEGVKKLYRETVDNPSIPAMLTGLPTIGQGVENVTDETGGPARKIVGGAQIVAGGIPYVGRLAGPIGSAVQGLTSTMPRTMLTYGTLGTLGNAENIADAVMPGAQAQGAQWTPPTEKQKKNRSWVMQQQDELIKEGLYPKNDPTYGSYGNATEEGLQRLWKRKQDAERERVRQEKLDSDRLGIERSKADAAKQEANTKAAGEKRKKEEGDKATDILSKADAARNEVSKAESPWIKYPRLIAPTLLGIGAGILSGGKMAKSSAAKGQENALTQQKAANRILSGSDPSVNEKIGKVNQFAQQGQQEPTKGWFGTQFGARPDKENWFVDNPSAKSAPHWMANPKALQSSALYPESRTGEHVRNAMLPGGIGGVEFGLGTAGDRYYSGQIADQEKIINDKLSTADAVRAAAANKSDYEWKKALSEFVQRTGATTALYGAGKGSHAIASRPPMRPNIAKADTWRGEINTAIGNARGKEAAAAKAEKAARAEEKARREATNPAAPSAAPAPRNRRRGPNGGGAAPLLPLAAGPMLSGDRSTREPYPELTGGASEDSYYNDEGFGRPYATGGHVEAPVKRHHSFFQPRKIGRFSGGPVYQKHHSNFQPRGKAGKWSGGPVYPELKSRFDEGGGVLPWSWRTDRHPGYEKPYSPPSATELGSGPGMQKYLDSRLRDVLDAARQGTLLGAGGQLMGHAIQRNLNPAQRAPQLYNRPLPEEGWVGFKAGGATEGQGTPSVPYSAGPIEGRTGGRADALNMTVEPGSFVVPADCVSGLPGAEGNTAAGMAILAKQFGPAQRSATSHGGVGIKISDGEYVLSREQVAKVGAGDVSHGHRVLDALVRRIRADHIKTLKSLPGPAQN